MKEMSGKAEKGLVDMLAGVGLTGVLIWFGALWYLVGGAVVLVMMWRDRKDKLAKEAKMIAPKENGDVT